MLETIKQALTALAAGLGLLKKRQELVNSPEQQANAAAKTEQRIKDDAREAIAKRDLEKIRRMAAE
jgi:hypothetical protein